MDTTFVSKVTVVAAEWLQQVNDYVFGRSGFVSAKTAGAAGDGITDDAVTLDTLSATLSAAGGGIIYLPPGTYLLGTISADPHAAAAYIGLRDNVSFIGSGVGVTILKVKSGQNAFYSTQNAPNIFGTQKTSLLTNVILRDFSVDWNGNQLAGGWTARSNATVLTNFGAQRLLVERVKIIGTPGNNPLMVANFNYATTPGGQVLVRNCEFYNGGSGLSGNVNTDHSCVYLVSDDSIIEGNYFHNDTYAAATTGYELHGSRSIGFNNRGVNMGQGTWIGADLATCSGARIDHDHFINCNRAFGVASASFGINDILITNSTYEQATGLGATYHALPSPYSFTTGGEDIALGTDKLTIRGCTFIGQSYEKNPFMSIYKVGNLDVSDNVITGFDDTANGYGILLVKDYSVSKSLETLKVHGNRMLLVKNPVYISSSLPIDYVSILNNVLTTGAAAAYPAITVTPSAAAGVIDNNVQNNFSSVATATAGVTNKQLTTTTSYSPPSLNAGLGATTTVSLFGAQVGNFVRVSFNKDLQDVLLTGWVSGTNTVSVRFQNNTAGVVAVASGSLTVAAYPL